MSREVRRVPPDWQHPAYGRVVARPEGHGVWNPVWHRLTDSEMDSLIGGRPRTHYQLYETVSEGTPLSPVMDTPEHLARWLVDNRITASGWETGTYAQWLAMIRGSGMIVGAVLTQRGWEPGWLDKPSEEPQR